VTRTGAACGKAPARWGAILVLAVGPIGLCGCGPAAPPQTTYVLGTPAPPVERTEPASGRPAIEVRPIIMPDYLDGSEILVRGAGNVLRPSPTGRWGERLSVGVTRALADDLRRRLPDFVVTTTEPPVLKSCELLMDVESFEQYIDQPVLLIAEWRVLGPASRKALAAERTSITQVVQGSGDAALVAAMSRALEGLADRVAPELQTLGPACSGQ